MWEGSIPFLPYKTTSALDGSVKLNLKVSDLLLTYWSMYKKLEFAQVACIPLLVFSSNGAVWNILVKTTQTKLYLSFVNFITKKTIKVNIIFTMIENFPESFSYLFLF